MAHTISLKIKMRKEINNTNVALEAFMDWKFAFNCTKCFARANFELSNFEHKLPDKLGKNLDIKKLETQDKQFTQQYVYKAWSDY